MVRRKPSLGGETACRVINERRSDDPDHVVKDIRRPTQRQYFSFQKIRYELF